MNKRAQREADERRHRMIVQQKGAKPLVKREIDYLLRNDKAKQAAGFIEPDMSDPYARHVEMFHQAEREARKRRPKPA